jgi:predicted outer membrane repeat protein
LVEGQVTITVTPVGSCRLSHWLVNGINVGNTNPITLTISSHTRVQPVFDIEVNNFTDTAGSGTVSGTLRYAVQNAVNGDIIRFVGVTPGTSEINLTSSIVINKDITIQGNGISIRKSVNDGNSMFYINNSTVNISRINFRDSAANEDPGAIYQRGGDLTLESCIFYNNRTLQGHGGAIYAAGALTVRGCTFHSNRTGSSGNGGAIGSGSGRSLILIGNIFYGNTAFRSPITYAPNVSATYNVVDVAYGTGFTQAGWNAGTGDTTFSILGISGNPININNFAPISTALRIIPSGLEGFPTTDFYGNTRTFPAVPGAVR